jgi:putative membrane protein
MHPSLSPRGAVAMNLRTIAILSFLVHPLSAGAADTSSQAFAENVARSDMFEMASARLVLEKGQADHVKQFARDMVRDHGKSTGALREAAGADGVALPEDMGPKLAEKFEALEPLTGPALDAAYISTQVSVHTEAVALFKEFAEDGDDGALKNYARKMEPTIRMHLVRAKGFNTE